LRLLEPILGSSCWAPIKRENPFPKPLVYSYLLESPITGFSHETQGKQVFTVQGVPRGRKVYKQWSTPVSPMRLLTTPIILPQCLAAYSTITSTLDWVDHILARLHGTH
jgi:hypothetical protein